jgi:hypothetical protein
MTAVTHLVLEASRKWCQHHVISHVCELCWWYNYGADVVPISIALAFVTKMSEKCRSTSPSAIQVKQWRKTVSIERKLHVISQIEKGCERTVDIFGNVRFSHISICTICDNADTITESTKCMCIKTTIMLSE